MFREVFLIGIYYLARNPLWEQEIAGAKYKSWALTTSEKQKKEAPRSLLWWVPGNSLSF